MKKSFSDRLKERKNPPTTPDTKVKKPKKPIYGADYFMDVFFDTSGGYSIEEGSVIPPSPEQLLQVFKDQIEELLEKHPHLK